jgi:hypothetical protein
MIRKKETALGGKEARCLALNAGIDKMLGRIREGQEE